MKLGILIVLCMDFVQPWRIEDSAGEATSFICFCMNSNIPNVYVLPIAEILNKRFSNPYEFRYDLKILSLLEGEVQYALNC